MDFMSKQTNLHTWLTKASQSYLKISCCSYFKTDCGEWNFLGDQLYLTYSWHSVRENNETISFISENKKMHDNSQEMDGVLQWQKQKLQRQKFPLEYFAPRRWAKRKLGKLTIVNYHLLRRSAGVQ